MRSAILMTVALLCLGAVVPTRAAHAASAAIPSEASADAAAADPLRSPRWGDMQKLFFAGQPLVFDARVHVSGPDIAEDSLNVPISVDASALPDVQEVLVFADFNPILGVLRFFPTAAKPSLGLRLKLQQSSPVRAAARTADGVWHVGGQWVTATGGGCTAPSTGSGSAEWLERLNEVSARVFPRIDGGSRLRLRIIHPMDTGLAPGVPVFHIEELRVADEAGAELMRIQPYEPVAENPLFTVDLPARGSSSGRIHTSGRDNNGNLIDAWVTP